MSTTDGLAEPKRESESCDLDDLGRDADGVERLAIGREQRDSGGPASRVGDDQARKQDRSSCRNPWIVRANRQRGTGGQEQDDGHEERDAHPGLCVQVLGNEPRMTARTRRAREDHDLAENHPCW